MSDPKSCTTLYKILLPSDYAALASSPSGSRSWRGAGIDLSDGFIHLSTSEQLAGTLQRFFSSSSPGVGDTVHILAIPRSRLDESQLKFEPAAGTLFGHIYGEVDPSHVFTERYQLQRNADGQFELPPQLTF